MTAPGGIRIPITADARGFEAELSRVVIAAMKKVQLKLDAKPLTIPVGLEFNDSTIAEHLRGLQTRLDKANLGVEIAVDLDDTGVIEQARAIHERVQAELRPVIQRVVVQSDQAAVGRVVAGEQRMQAAQRVSGQVAQAVASDRQKAAAQLEKVTQQIQKSANAERAAQNALAAARKSAEAAQPDPEAQLLKQQKAAQQLTAAMNRLAVAKKAAEALSEDASSDQRAAAADRVAAAEVRVAEAKRAAKAAEPDPAADALKREQAAQRVEAAELRIADARRRSADLAQQASRLQQRANTPDIRVPSVSGASTGRLRGDADASTTAFTRLGSAIGSVAATSGRLAGVTAIVAGIGGAAGAATGLVGGLATALAAVGPAAGAITATAIVGLNGFKDAFKAAFDAADNGPKEAADKTKAVASAQDQLANAADNAESAQRSLASAQKDSQRAAEDVGRAYQQAGRDLEDAMLRARGATISQKEAAIDLREATKQAQQSMFNPAQHEKDLVALERAQLRYDQAVEDNTRAQQDNADAQAKGIENSDAVTAAKEKQQAADERVADAQRAAAKASEDVAKAAQNLADVQNQATPSAQKFADAMAKLSPNAREFVNAALSLKPAVEGVQMSVQDIGFEGLGATLTDVASRVIPAVQTGMNALAGQFNSVAKEALNFAGSVRGIQAINDVFAGASNLVQGLRSGTGEATQGILDFVHTAEPAMQGLGTAIAHIGDSIGAAFSQSAASGQLASVFDGLNKALEGIGPLLGGFTTALLTISDRVLPTLGPLFDSLGTALQNLAPGLGDLGAAFADALTPILPQLGTFISDLAKGLAPILPVVSKLLSSLMTALTPMIGPLSQIVQVIGNALVGAVDALAPAMGPLAQAFADLLTAVAPIVPLIAENLSAAIQALAPALSTVFQALAPVIQSFATQMQPVIQQLAPVLAQVAMTLGQALANALQELAPFLPQLVSAFANLLLAVVPLLPQLVDLAVQVMPGMIDVLKLLLPVLTDIINAFSWFVTEVVQKLLLPALKLITDDWQTMNDFIGKGVDWLTDTLFPKIGEAIDKVKGWFDDGVKGIRTIWDGLKSAAADPVKFVVGTVWNEGLRKAWNSVAKFLPGLGELDQVTLGFARGGGVNGPGSGTSDDILAYLSNGEHVVTAREVMAAGGQNILYAIRDMIARGIPFTWDNGRIITDLGRDNLDRYGAAVAAKGIGNVSPEGLFDQLQPRFKDGGAVEPWMYQLLAGHDFAKAQSGKAYQWAGPRFVGDSFDCSGFMGSIAAAILGLNPWQRYWSTSSFAGYPQTGPMGFTRGPDAGFTVGVTDDPGGPGGGHTAGVLGALPLLGIATAMRAESGGALGDVHYGAGTDPTSFASIYHLPIGANGFFQPGVGGGSVGPSVQDQHGFLARKISDIITGLTDPIRRRIDTEVGPPPPEFRKIPGEFLGAFENGSVKYLTGLADGLTDGLSSAWSKAKSVGSTVVDAGRKVLDFVTPFDSGGLANGTGFMPKNVIAPERVLSPEQTRLFDAMVMSLQQIAGGTPGRADPDLLTNAVFTSGIDVLSNLLGVQVAPRQTPEDQKFQEQTAEAISATGQVAADTRDLVLRSESSQELVTQQQTEQLRAVLTEISNRLTGGVLTPIMQSAFDSALGVVKDWLGSGFGTVVDAANATTAAVNNLNGTVATTPGGNNPGPGAVSPFGAPGSAFDAVSEISKAVQSVAQAATSAFQQVAQQVANAALAQQDSKVQNSRGTLGKDISGGPLVDMIVRLTGVNIEIRDNLTKANDEIRRFRGDQANAYDATGRIVADTADLMQRNESSRDLVIQEMNRLNTALMKAVLRYLITAVLIPILTAILSAMIQLVVTAIGAAIGSIIPGIGTAIGAAIGAVVGAALAGLAAVVVSGIAVGAGAAIDSFDSGGVASGIGFMPKDTIAPERVLSPRQTEDFGRLVDWMTSGGFGSKTVNAPITVYGGPGAAGGIQNRLLELL